MRASLFITSALFIPSTSSPAFAQQAPIIPSLIWMKSTVDKPLSPSWTLSAGDKQRTLRTTRYRRAMHPRFEYRFNREGVSPMLTFRVARHMTPELGLGVSVFF